ncbi:uncharacterized protein LOC109716886 [Ananas comosus]|uniref:Uncharacterized protein LOC109716886 n=1 Tax=Ananas comosus TaxID=4615 RepID=A0A6P5FYL9_ANACO|nr:uncharacterized protein LOC109716886 [Ananas comosus]XP_020098081.1 uncharacterized protein LOC109716886 [Ananas comosus]
MEHSKAILAAPAPSETLAASQGESLISALLYDVSQQVQGAIQNMLKMTSEIEQSSCEIMEEIKKCKESVAVRNNILEEERDRFKKAAMAVLEMLNGSEAL